MGISYIPGPEQILAPAFQQIMTGLQQYLQPNRAFQEKMRAEIAANPDLLQKLADLNTINPGVLNQMGFGPLTGVIGGTPQSIVSQYQQQNRPAILNTLTAENEAKGREAEVNAGVNLAVKNMMAANPTLTEEAALKQITGETATTRAQRPAVQAKTDTTVQQEALTQRGLGALPDPATVNWRQEAMKSIAGTLPGETLFSYMSNPEAKASFDTALRTLENERDRVARAENSIKRGEGLTESYRINKAFSEYQKSGGFGTLEMWEKFLFDPATRQRGLDLASGKIKVDPKSTTDEELKHIGGVTAQQMAVDKLEQFVTINAKINGQMEVARKETDDSRLKIHIGALNKMFADRAKLGAPVVVAKFDDTGILSPFRPGRVKYYDENGNALEENIITAELADPTASAVSDTAKVREQAAEKVPLPRDAQAAYEGVNAYVVSGGTLEEALGALQMQDPTPGKRVSTAVKKRLVAEGRIKE